MNAEDRDFDGKLVDAKTGEPLETTPLWSAVLQPESPEVGQRTWSLGVDHMARHAPVYLKASDGTELTNAGAVHGMLNSLETAKATAERERFIVKDGLGDCINDVERLEQEAATLRAALEEITQDANRFYDCAMEFGEDAPRACGEHLDILIRTVQRYEALTANQPSEGEKGS